MLPWTIVACGEQRVRALIAFSPSAADEDCRWVRYEGLREDVDS